MINADPNSSEFNSYATVEDLEKFANDRGIDLPENKEVLLIKAMDYLNGLDWVGKKAKPDQTLPFPRKDIVLDDYLLPSGVIPIQLIVAQCMLAIEAISGDLLSSIREAPIKSEAIAGAMTITYAVEETGFKPQYTAVMAILRDLVINGKFSINCVAERV